MILRENTAVFMLWLLVAIPSSLSTRAFALSISNVTIDDLDKTAGSGPRIQPIEHSYCAKDPFLSS